MGATNMKASTTRFINSTFKHSKLFFVPSRATGTIPNNAFSTTPTTTNAGTLTTPPKYALPQSAMTTAPKAKTESNNCKYFSFNLRYFHFYNLPFFIFIFINFKISLRQIQNQILFLLPQYAGRMSLQEFLFFRA